MFFKNWLKLLEVKDIFSQKEENLKSDISSLIGFKKPLQKFSQGSLAILYQHPTNKNLLIKVTSHKEDVNNIIKAQKIDSANVVKVFPWDKKGTLIKSLPSLKSFAIIVEKILGTSMIYTTSEFFDLSLNGEFELAADWLDSTVHKNQKLILDHYNKNTPEEHIKLASLFRTLSKLESFYGIELSDFQDNILDTGNRYVIVDMGF